MAFTNTEEAELKMQSRARILACEGERGAKSHFRPWPKWMDEEEAIAWKRTHRPSVSSEREM